MFTWSVRTTALIAIATALALPHDIRAAQAKWTTLAPKDDGFSIEVPATPTVSSRPGHYVYEADEWAFFVQVDPVSDTVRESVRAADRGPIRQYLDTIHKGMIRDATERSSSTADFNGFPSLKFSADGEAPDKQKFEGKYWLIATERHLYMLMALGPQGSSTADADRFLGSFRLVGQMATRSGSRPTPKTTSREELTPLAQPILAVAYMISEQRLKTEIDEHVKNAPAAKRLGNRWNTTSPAWEKAQGSYAVRLARIVESYESEGELKRNFEDGYTRLISAPQADALVGALNGPAGGAIIRQEAMVEFISIVMADDPKGPKPGERAWTDQMRALSKTFDEGAGSVMPRDPARDGDVTKFFATPTGEVFKRFFNTVVEKAATQIVGAARVVFFDQRDAINREIESAVATVR